LHNRTGEDACPERSDRNADATPSARSWAVKWRSR
jgi:hypothetical protein